MKLCFYQRITLIVVGVVMLILLLFFYASNHLQSETRFEAEQSLHQKLAYHLIEDNPLLKDGVYDYGALDNLFHTLMLLGPRFEFYYLDTEGNILTHSTTEDALITNKIDLNPIKNFINGNTDFPLRAQDPKDINSTKIFSAAEVRNNSSLQGYLYVIIGGKAYDSIFENLQESYAMRRFSLFIIAGGLTLLMITIVLFKLITSPLRRLSNDMQEFRKVNYQLEKAKLSNQIWCADSRSEIDKLGIAFNELFVHIDKQFQALKKNDSQRKEVLADLSHDLRTPLASMQGYMETLQLKGSSIAEADRHKFVEICMRNMKNLKQLIDQIFELAYLEGGEIEIVNEDCSVVELLHDIKGKFQVEAEKKNIQLSVEADKFGHLVKTDIGKLERVLSNLIDNAIRHTPSGGSVSLEFTVNDNKGELCIKDSGVGIQLDDISQIFNPRYRGKNKIDDSKKHAGLGLAISQKLVSYLGSKLMVESKVSEGAKFYFYLPVLSN